MFFLPAELAKEAGNEVLSNWMGNLGTSQDVSFTLCHVSQFSFLAGQCNSFPTLPLLSELLARVYYGSVSTFLVTSFFTFCWLQFCYHCDVDRSVNKVLLHCCVADKMHSVCQKQHFSFSQISTHVSMTWLKHGTCFPFMYYTLTANTSKNIFALKTLERLSLS